MVPALYQNLLGDPRMASLMGEDASLSAMLDFEACLAHQQARLGIIPDDAAQRITQAVDGLRLDPAALSGAVAVAGIAAQPVIAALKKASGDAAGWVHFGATSQDVVDTGLMIQLQPALDLLRRRLDGLMATLLDKAQEYASQPIPAHTRFQIAAPTTLGALIAVWRDPLQRQMERLDQLSPRLLKLSLFGAAGTSAALGPQAGELRRHMAAELGLSVTDTPWHSLRDNIADLGSWLSLMTGSLGKIGADLVLMSQSERAHVSAGTGGGSSTMPQKSNPVAAETLVTLARLNAGDLGTLHQALVHAQQRDGSALGLEWSLLPAMMERAAASLRIAGELAETLSAHPERIAESFAADRGMMMAEAASFQLSREMSRPEAQKIVAEALRLMQSDPGMTLAGALNGLAPAHDWAELLAPEQNLGDAVQIAKQTDNKQER